MQSREIERERISEDREGSLFPLFFPPNFLDGVRKDERCSFLFCLWRSAAEGGEL